MNKKGFTLIELLVVVLIIGILSSVALPQYQKTVLKSRAAEAWTNLSAISKAINVYCLENPSGGYFDKDQLSISVEDSKYFRYDLNAVCVPYAGGSRNTSYATYLGGKNIYLGISDSGSRICKGSDCKELGFTSLTTGSPCLCGSGDTCYFMN